MAGQDIPEALYVHVPFCVHKCAYCDFYSVEGAGDRDFDAWLEALDREASAAPPTILRTVYVGGGTPTVLSAAHLSRLMGILRSRFDLSRVVEFTVEANPGTLDDDRLGALLAAGVNRISLGVQSMQLALLGILGRVHGPQDV
jgi:oxygen-independent coproporphyrinogen-3 oxidase